MKKILSAAIILILFSLTINISAAGTVYPRCDYIVWGKITEGYVPVRGMSVILDANMTGGTVLECKTNDDGIYSFYSYGQFTDQVTIVLETGAYKNINVKQYGTAYRLDFKSGSFLSLEESPIVYITEFGDRYHRYGCYHLAESCRPVPQAYCYMYGIEACENCFGF